MTPSSRRAIQSMQMLLAILLPTMTFLPIQAMATDTPRRPSETSPSDKRLGPGTERHETSDQPIETDKRP